MIPAFMIVEEDSDGRTLMKVDPRYSEKEIVAMTIISLIGGAPFDDSAYAALLRLLGGRDEAALVEGQHSQTVNDIMVASTGKPWTP